MHNPFDSNPITFITFICIALLALSPCTINGAPALHTFMYKYCSTAKHGESDGMFNETRQILLQKLLARSSQSKFYKTGVIPDQRAALWGHYQCRGDLTAEECHGCVESLSGISSNSWCADSLSGRIQLSGCHVQYEADGSEIPGADLTHRECGEEWPAAEAGGGVLEAMSAAFAAVESGVVESPDGYWSAEVGGVRAVGECAEGLRGCDCGECVGEAVGVVEEECAGAVSGRVYTDLCFVSFEFRPEVGPADSNPGGPGRGSGGGIGSGKLVAIAAGGVALVAIGFIVLQKSFKKDDDF